MLPDAAQTQPKTSAPVQKCEIQLQTWCFSFKLAKMNPSLHFCSWEGANISLWLADAFADCCLMFTQCGQTYEQRTDQEFTRSLYTYIYRVAINQLQQLCVPSWVRKFFQSLFFTWVRPWRKLRILGMESLAPHTSAVFIKNGARYQLTISSFFDPVHRWLTLQIMPKKTKPADLWLGQ